MDLYQKENSYDMHYIFMVILLTFSILDMSFHIFLFLNMTTFKEKTLAMSPYLASKTYFCVLLKCQRMQECVLKCY